MIFINLWLHQASKKLRESSIDSARLDAEILLADMLDKDRSWLLAHPEAQLTSHQLKKLDDQIEHRAKHEPLAYIRGFQEFYGRDFAVTKDTLTPRPETETMVELALNVLKDKKIPTIADIGTGSGCIIISLQLESQTEAEYTGYDVSSRALTVAKRNATELKSNVAFEYCDLLNDCEQNWQSADLLLANLPYVPDDYEINSAAKHEPRLALFAGEDGLDYYRALFSKATKNNQFIFTESLEFQHKVLENVATAAEFKLEQTCDLIQVFMRTG